MNSFTEKLNSRFENAIAQFLEESNYSRAAYSVIEKLKDENSKILYDRKNRNIAVEVLASHVESDIGCTASLMFRCDSPLHNSLQTLMNVYYDTIDGVYYKDVV